MRVRSLLCAAVAVACLASPARAQAEWRIDGFTTTPNGFSGMLVFRNAQQHTDTPILGLHQIVIRITPDGAARCGGDCGFNSNRIGTIGAVDTQDYDFGDFRYDYVGSSWNEDSCGGDSCLRRIYDSFSYGVLGCPVAALDAGAVAFYHGRTCAADGYDGWFVLPFQFLINGGNPSRTPFVLGDFEAEFRFRTVGNGGPNVFLTPEPGTTALLGAGLVALLVGVRRRSSR